MSSDTDLPPLPRCCPAHASWHGLADHLIGEFPTPPIRHVLRELLRAREAATTAGVADREALETAELIARHQLLLLAGRSTDVARLDPETHRRL